MMETFKIEEDPKNEDDPDRYKTEGGYKKNITAKLKTALEMKITQMTPKMRTNKNEDDPLLKTTPK